MNRGVIFFRKVERYLIYTLLLTALSLSAITSAQGNFSDPRFNGKIDTSQNPYGGSRTLPPLEHLLPLGKSSWDYRRTAEYLYPAAKEIVFGDLPETRRRTQLTAILLWIDSLTSQIDASGAWWSPSSGRDGDPNVNRFVLVPLLDTILALQSIPEVSERFITWKSALNRAVDLQVSAYKGNVDWDWAAAARGQYANQDIYYALAMGLASRVFGREDYQVLADSAIRRLESTLLPDGGFHYIGRENESPLYHAVTQILLARYYELTQSPEVMNLLRESSRYWLLALTAEGVAETWSDVWWKQLWVPIPDTALTISAAVTADGHLEWLKQQLLGRSGPKGSFADVYGAYWWRRGTGNPPPLQYHVKDENIRGSRGRDGDWYYGVTQGRGLRNTFVGGLISSSKTKAPLQAAFRGAQIEVKIDKNQKHGYWLSQIEDQTATKMISQQVSLLGARYTLQPSQINGVPQPSTPPSPWEVTQVWLAGPQGTLGSVTVQAKKNNNASSVTGRILLGPEALRKLLNSDWTSGSLKIHFYRQFGSVIAKEIPAEASSSVDHWPGLEFSQLVNGMKTGDKFQYIVWVGPSTALPPSAVSASLDGRSLKAKYNQTNYSILFNPESRTISEDN